MQTNTVYTMRNDNFEAKKAFRLSSEGFFGEL